jgi:hypothetical protein
VGSVPPVTPRSRAAPGRTIAPERYRCRDAIPVDRISEFALAEHFRRYPPGRGPRVHHAKGGPVRRQTFYHRVWGPALEAAELQGFRFGQLRHTGATMALEAGANPVLVAFRLGHVSTRMVEQHYAGRLDRADREIAEALDAPSNLPIVGADDGIRTRDPHLGKVVLYQLSHVRTPLRGTQSLGTGTRAFNGRPAALVRRPWTRTRPRRDWTAEGRPPRTGGSAAGPPPRAVRSGRPS